MRKFLVLGLALMLLVDSSIIVAAETIVNETWEGSGYNRVEVVAGNDAATVFETSGGYIKGTFQAVDKNDNPHGYGVDSFNSRVNAEFNSSGWMSYQTDRTDSKASYGAAGQSTYSFVTSNISGKMAYASSNNYAAMTNGGVSSIPKTVNNRSFEATGTHIIYHTLTDSDGDGSSVNVVGNTNSSASKVRMFGAKSKGSSFNMGRLGVCGDGTAWYDHYATYEGSGDISFNQNAWADNELTIGSNGHVITTIPGDGTDNSAQWNLNVEFSGNWSHSDLGISGN